MSQKIAVSLFGYFDTVSTGKVGAGFDSYHKIKAFFGDRKVDYYIHSWQPDRHKDLVDLYSPIAIRTEPQIDFDKIGKENGIYQEWYDEGIDRVALAHTNCTIHRSLSSFYTRTESIKLISNIEQYDYVFTMRADVGNVGPNSVNFPHRFTFGNNKLIYTPYWECINVGLGDMWTILCGEHAKHLTTLYDRVLGYYKPDSKYIKDWTTAWPYSEAYDFNNHAAPELRSNISLSKKECKPMAYPRWYAINNHAIYKYFFIDCGLYKHMEFI